MENTGNKPDKHSEIDDMVIEHAIDGNPSRPGIDLRQLCQGHLS